MSASGAISHRAAPATSAGSHFPTSTADMPSLNHCNDSIWWEFGHIDPGSSIRSLFCTAPMSLLLCHNTYCLVRQTKASWHLLWLASTTKKTACMYQMYLHSSQLSQSHLSPHTLSLSLAVTEWGNKIRMHTGQSGTVHCCFVWDHWIDLVTIIIGWMRRRHFVVSMRTATVKCWFSDIQ